jgi:hypothetical protein
MDAVVSAAAVRTLATDDQRASALPLGPLMHEWRAGARLEALIAVARLTRVTPAVELSGDRAPGSQIDASRSE